jgi:hypothetical protein
MCLGVFLASDQPLDLVPWNERTPGFNVVPLSEHEEPVRRQFALAHVVYAGAHTRCSCGFRADGENPDAVSRSQAALVEYIRRASLAGPLEIFVCWEGDYEKAARVRLERSADALSGDDWLQELTFTRVSRRPTEASGPSGSTPGRPRYW